MCAWSALFFKNWWLLKHHDFYTTTTTITTMRWLWNYEINWLRLGGFGWCDTFGLALSVCGCLIDTCFWCCSLCKCLMMIFWVCIALWFGYCVSVPTVLSTYMAAAVAMSACYICVGWEDRGPKKKDFFTCQQQWERDTIPIQYIILGWAGWFSPSSFSSPYYYLYSVLRLSVARTRIRRDFYAKKKRERERERFWVDTYEKEIQINGWLVTTYERERER